LVQARSVAPGATIQALSFRQGTIEMKIGAKDASSLDHVCQSLRSNGWQCDLTSGNTTSSGYEGRIQIRPR
jgi:type II secretory pathway component PulL